MRRLIFDLSLGALVCITAGCEPSVQWNGELIYHYTGGTQAPLQITETQIGGAERAVEIQSDTASACSTIPLLSVRNGKFALAWNDCLQFADVETGTILQTTTRPASVWAVAWSSGGDALAIVERSNESAMLVLLDASLTETAQLAVPISLPSSGKVHLSWSADDALIAVSAADDVLNAADQPAQLFDVSTGRFSSLPATNVYFLGDRRLIATDLRDAVPFGGVIPSASTFVADLQIGSPNQILHRSSVHANTGALASDPVGGIALVGVDRLGLIAAKPLLVHIVDRDGNESGIRDIPEIGTGFFLAVLGPE